MSENVWESTSGNHICRPCLPYTSTVLMTWKQTRATITLVRIEGS
jgi:hypothetical protein